MICLSEHWGTRPYLIRWHNNRNFSEYSAALQGDLYINEDSA
jgi:hypothetical protein